MKKLLIISAFAVLTLTAYSQKNPYITDSTNKEQLRATIARALDALQLSSSIIRENLDDKRGLKGLYELTNFLVRDSITDNGFNSPLARMYRAMAGLKYIDEKGGFFVENSSFDYFRSENETVITTKEEKIFLDDSLHSLGYIDLSENKLENSKPVRLVKVQGGKILLTRNNAFVFRDISMEDLAFTAEYDSVEFHRNFYILKNPGIQDGKGMTYVDSTYKNKEGSHIIVKNSSSNGYLAVIEDSYREFDYTTLLVEPGRNVFHFPPDFDTSRVIVGVVPFGEGRMWRLMLPGQKLPEQER